MELTARACARRGRCATSCPTRCGDDVALPRCWTRPASHPAAATARRGAPSSCATAALKATLRDLYLPGWYEYLAQSAAGLVPWAPITDLDAEQRAIEGADCLRPTPRRRAPGASPSTSTRCRPSSSSWPTCASWRPSTATPSTTPSSAGRRCIPSCGASSRRHATRGWPGVMTTMVVRRETEVRAAFGIPDHMAVAALVALGRPVHQPQQAHAPSPWRTSPPSTAFDGPASARARADRPPTGRTDVTRRHTRLIEFRVEDDLGRGRGHGRSWRAAHDGWVNLHPQVRPEDEPPPRSGLTTLLLAGPVHDVPVCTWVAGKLGARRASNRTRSASNTPREPGCAAGWPRPDWPCPTAGRSCRTTPVAASWSPRRAGADNGEVLPWLLEAGIDPERGPPDRGAGRPRCTCPL